MISQLLTVTLLTHIIAGAAALLSGFVAIATTKGAKRHLQSGWIYVRSMAIVVVTAIPIALFDSNWFLFTIAIFSGYLVFTGDRVLSRKRPEPGVAAPIDWAGHGLMAVTGGGMIAFGGWGYLSGTLSLGPALIVFGLIGLVLAVREIHEIRNPPADRMQWFYKHIGFMGGGYIATVTASITVNLTMVPPLLRWVGPTVIGIPLIMYAVRKYETQFTPSRAESAAD